MNNKKLLAIMVGATLLVGCATESYNAVEEQHTKAEQTASQYQGVKHKIVIGNFLNQSSYNNGIFADESGDRLSNQAQVILATHLQQTGRFNVLNRANLDAMAKEAKFNKQNLKIKGANYVITGGIVEFGRKEVGDHQLYGILGRGKKQVAYAKVALNVVNATTSETVYTSQGAGEYNLSNREIVGFGGTAGYDVTLNGKVLDLAIREAVDNLIKNMGN